jgi:hypothetical protein
VRRTVFGTTAAASERELYGCRGFCPFCRPLKLRAFSLAGLGTSGWRGSLSAEGVKSSVQLVTAKRCSSGTGRPVFIDKVYLHAQTPGRRLRRLHKIATAIMTKRKRLGDDEQKCRSKRIRSETFSQLELSKLSDELVLKILTYLPIEDLAVAQRYVSSPPLTIGLTDTE